MIKPIDKKAPDFVFFAPRLRINKVSWTRTSLTNIVNILITINNHGLRELFTEGSND